VKCVPDYLFISRENLLTHCFRLSAHTYYYNTIVLHVPPPTISCVSDYTSLLFASFSIFICIRAFFALSHIISTYSILYYTITSQQFAIHSVHFPSGCISFHFCMAMTIPCRDNAGQRDGWVDENDECAAGRKVPELLAEQIESADILLLNKIDIAGPEQVAVAAALARTINEKAILEEVEFGKVTSPKQIIRDDKAVVMVEAETSCTDADCNSHDHSHSHEGQGHAAATEDESSSSECTDPDCTDESHDHSSSSKCMDSDCTDESHDHDHSHSHSSSSSSSPTSTSTSTENLGIVSFVYKANRPFEPRNLMDILNTWPVPIKEDLEGLEQFRPASDSDGSKPAGRESPFFGVLRSKGFCWLAPTVWNSNQGGDQWRHDTAMYWSHAGKHFGITTAGKWWAALDESKMKGYFQNDVKQYERILKEDFVSEQWGDRRQEIVFIGVNIDEEKITKALDDCLIGDKGMERYSQQLNNYMNTILTVPVTEGKGGLFDVGNYDNLDVDA